MRVPSRDTLTLRPPISDTVFAAPPSSGSDISVAPRTNSIDWLSALQKYPGGTPSVVTCVGFAEPSAGTTYRLATPARSHVNAMRRLSRDQSGFDGCLMSISCSIVSDPPGGCGARGAAAMVVTRAAAAAADRTRVVFMRPPYIRPAAVVTPPP